MRAAAYSQSKIIALAEWFRRIRNSLWEIKQKHSGLDSLASGVALEFDRYGGCWTIQVQVHGFVMKASSAFQLFSSSLTPYIWLNLVQ